MPSFHELNILGFIFASWGFHLSRQRLAWLGGGAGALLGGYAVLMLVEFWQRSAV